MKWYSAVLLVLVLVSLAQAQQKWTRTYGGTNDDYGRSVQQTSDGGYIIAGWTYSFGAGHADVWLIKTDASGNPLWTKTYGGTNEDRGYYVQQTSDGGYIVLGSTGPVGSGNHDIYLIKTNSSGDTLWTRTYGGALDDYCYSLQQTSDGGYVIAGQTASFGAGLNDFYLIKTNASGDTLWTRTYGGTGNDDGRSVLQTADNGYLIAGYTNSFGAGSYDAYLIRTNSSGDTLWTKTYGGTDDDWGDFLQPTTDGGCLIAGSTVSFGAGQVDVYLIRTNASGDTLFTRTYGGTLDDESYAVRQTTDGGYVLAGETFSRGAGNADVWLIKTDASGDTLWSRTYGGPNDEYSYSVQQTTDGGYIIAGYTTSFGAGNNDFYVIKTDGNGNVGVENGRDKGSGIRGQEIRATPNPFINYVTVPGYEKEGFEVYDVAGRKVGTYHGERVGEGLSPGVYFVRPEQGNLKPLRVVKLR